MNLKEKPSNEQLLNEAKELSLSFKQQLPSVADPAAVSTTVKLPFKVLSVRELMLWRISDFAENAVELIEKLRIVPAIIIIRAILESVALLFTLYSKVEEAITKESIEGLDEDVLKLLLGERLESKKITSFNVLTLIDRLNKEANGFRQFYDDLSEFAHPNWSGGLGSYGKINEEKFWLELRRINDINDYPYTVALTSLIASLESVQIIYNDLGSHLPEFSRLCEKLIVYREKEV